MCGMVFSACQQSAPQPNPTLKHAPSTPTQISPTATPKPTIELSDFGVVNSGICARLPQGELVFAPENSSGERCLAGGAPSTIPDAECVAARLAQSICNDEPTALQTLCVPGYEIDCQRFGLLETLAEPLPQSLCTGLTVGGVGYAVEAQAGYELNGECLAAPEGWRNEVVNCAFLGQTFALNAVFCERLTSCAEPKLNELFEIVGNERGIPLFNFPSGVQPLVVELSCSERALTSSLHHLDQGCRAIDINVNKNYGNLRVGEVPLSTIPPEFVAVMESCGVVWGGRYNGADNVAGGCDPMEFAFAPACQLR